MTRPAILPMGVLEAEREPRILAEQRAADLRVVREALAVEVCEQCGTPKHYAERVVCVTTGPDGYPEFGVHGPFIRLDPPAAPLLVPMGEASDDLWENDEEGA